MSIAITPDTGVFALEVPRGIKIYAPNTGVFALKVPRGIKIYAPNMGVFALEVLRGIKILNRRIDLQIILENKLDKTYSR